MAKTQNKELAVIDFTQFSVAQLPELKGKKEEIASVIEANPIVEIVDNATYESAKRSRTAVKTLRTGLEKEQKEVERKIKEHVLGVVKQEYDTLVLGVKTAEQSRQEPIDVWEEKKEEERKEKARLEQQRIDGIKAKIKFFSDSWTENINNLKFSEIAEVSKLFGSVVDLFDKKSLEEFDVLFDREASNLAQLMQNKISTLQEQEQIRIDNLLIQEKNAENTRIQEWQRIWNANIDSLSFGDIADVKSILVKSKLADLKHYVSGYEEIYLSTEKRLHSQIEFVSKAEEQQIAQEKFEKERKEFEEKQSEAKFQSRVKQLTDIGIDMAVFELEHKGDPRWMNLKTSAKIESDSDWNETLAWVNMQISLRDEKVDNKVTNNSVPVTLSETIEVVVEEVVESEIKFDSEPIVSDFIPITGSLIVRADYRESNGVSETQEVEFEETWDSIYSDWLNSDDYKYNPENIMAEWLKKHYNVPTKKQ